MGWGGEEPFVFPHTHKCDDEVVLKMPDNNTVLV